MNSRFLGTQPQPSTDIHNCIKGACPVDKPLAGPVTFLRPGPGWREIRELFQFFLKSAAPTLRDSLPSPVRRPHRERPVPRPALRRPRMQAQERSGVATERLSASRMFLWTPDACFSGVRLGIEPLQASCARSGPPTPHIQSFMSSTTMSRMFGRVDAVSAPVPAGSATRSGEQQCQRIRTGDHRL